MRAAAASSSEVLRKPASLYAFLQVFGNSIGHEFERQFTALVLSIKSDDVETVACRDRFRADCARLEGKQGRFEFGRCLAGRDLAEIAAARSRRASRVHLRQFSELFGMLTQDGEHGYGSGTPLSITQRVGLAGTKQDMRHFINVAGAEAPPVLLVIAPAYRDIGFRRLNFLRDERANSGFIVGFPTAFAVSHRFS